MKEIDKQIMMRLTYNPVDGRIFWSEMSDPRESGKQAGSVRGSGYMQIQVCGKRFYSHRVAFFLFYGYWPSGIIDHINGDKKDNSIRNLRDCNKSLNGGNSKKSKNRTSKFKGVSRYRDGRWLAQISKDGKNYFLGYHVSEIDAAMAYAEAADNLYGNFSKCPGLDDGTI